SAKPDKADQSTIPADKRAEIIDVLKKAAKKYSEGPKSKQALDELQNELEAAKKGRVSSKVTRTVRGRDGEVTYPSAKAKDRDIKDLEEQIAKAKEPGGKPITDPAMLVSILPLETKVGELGRLYPGKVRVDQVVDGSTAIITNYYVE